MKNSVAYQPAARQLPMARATKLRKAPTTGQKLGATYDVAFIDRSLSRPHHTELNKVRGSWQEKYLRLIK